MLPITTDDFAANRLGLYLFSFGGAKFTWVKFALVLWAVLLSGPLAAEVTCSGGQTCTQTLELTPGWNAIYVQVKPDEERTEHVFADFLDGSGPQIGSVWTWLAHRAKIEFIQDPSEELLSAPGWLRFFPEQSTQAFLTNLFALQANRAYLVKLEGADNATLTITGRPVVPRCEWSPNSYNLTGFHIDPLNPPTFADFFAASPAHQGQPIYQLLDNAWQWVDPFTTPIQPDLAYWVFSKGGSDYTGPLQVDLPQVNRLEYGQTLEQLTARLHNRADSLQEVALQVLGAAPGMQYPNPDLTAVQRWLPLPQLLNVSLDADGESRLPLGMRRADFDPGDFEQTLEITGSGGSRWLVPVTASAPPLNSLWVGTVTIEKVSQAQNYQHNCDVDGKNPGTGGFKLCLDDNGFPIGDSGDVLTPVAAQFSFRIILHRDTAGQVRLLKDVIQMWQDGEGEHPGHYVLLTDDTLIPNFKGVALRDGETVGRRISTMAYDFPGDTLSMSGSLKDTLEATLSLAPSAPTNPFRHHYHPDHNSLAIDYTTPNAEAYEVVRTMKLRFDPTAGLSLGSGYNDTGGTYREVVTGLHKYPIYAEGRFSLRHAAPTDTLNK